MDLSKVVKRLINRVWHSPTMMTWGSFATRSLSLVLVLPLILTKLSTADIALWYLFSTVISLQMLVDMGFSSTFARVIAFAYGGAGTDQLDRYEEKTDTLDRDANWNTIEHISATMRVIYARLAGVAFIGLCTLGTWAVATPISESPNSFSAWVAWGVVLLASTIVLRGNTFSAYLQGTNHIALLRRWEAITGLGAILTSFLVLVLDGGLLGLVIANQGWSVLNIFRNWWLCRVVEEGRFRQFVERGIHTDVFQAVWPSAWRSGLGVFMSYGLVQLSGVIYAQLGSTDRVATYLLSLRMIDVVSKFSKAPFYSKLPVLARLRAQGRGKKQVGLAKQGMGLSYWAYAVGFIGLGLFAEPLLQFIGSNAEFADPLLWILLGMGTLVERYGAMHIQLYSTTNHIVWHVANGGAGLIYITTSLLLYKLIGVYAFPAGILAGYLGFYAWYSASYSYSAFEMEFWSFESDTLFKPLFIILTYVVIALVYSGIS